MNLTKNNKVGIKPYAGMVEWGCEYMRDKQGDLEAGWSDHEETDSIFDPYLLEQAWYATATYQI